MTGNRRPADTRPARRAAYPPAYRPPGVTVDPFAGSANTPVTGNTRPTLLELMRERWASWQAERIARAAVMGRPRLGPRIGAYFTDASVDLMTRARRVWALTFALGAVTGASLALIVLSVAYGVASR
jgi:hypothetical protein